MDGLLCCFSPGGETLAIATTGDGRIRTFDTGNGRLRATLSDIGSSKNKGGASGLHGNNTCIAWLSRSKGKKAIGGALLVGTSGGDVKAYDAALGELLWRTQQVIEGGVLALSCSSSGDGLVYVTGASQQVVSLDPATGEVKGTFEGSKNAISCLALSPDGTSAFLGGSHLSLWDLASKEKRVKFSGHPTPAFTAAFSPDGSHIISAAESERQVAVWLAKKKKKTQPAVASLTLEDTPVQLDACSAHSSTSGFYAAAVSKKGEVYVWQCSPSTLSDEAESQTLKPLLVAKVKAAGGSKAAADSIMAVKIQSGSKGPILLVARGSSAVPVFEKVQVSDLDPSSFPLIISLQPSPSSGLMSNAPQGQGQGQGSKATHSISDVTILGPESLMGARPATMARGVAADAGPSRKRAEPDDEPPPSSHATQEEALPEEDDEEQPLGQRVSELEERANGGSSSRGGEGDLDEAGPSTSALPKGSSRTDSLAVLMTQALRSNDRALLEKCLSAGGNQRLVTNTVKRLLPSDAALFLRAAVDRVLSRPSRAAQLAPWVKALIHHHTGYLMSAPGAQGPLAALYQAIEGRVGMYQQLLKVYGRLSLVVAHSASKGAGEEGDEGEEGALPDPEVVFVDQGEEEPEAEDPFAPMMDDEDEDEEDEDDDEADDEDDHDEDEDEDGDEGNDPMSEDDVDDDDDD